MYRVVENRQIDENTKVFVYFNLHKHVFSVKALNGPYKGLVVLHTSKLAMKDCEFRVQDAGRKKVLAEKRKNVHAGVVGYLTNTVENATTEVTYNPYLYSTFVERYTKEPVTTAVTAILENKRVFVTQEPQNLALF